MKPLKFLLVFILTYSCSNHPETHSKYLNGYWEIENVTFTNGQVKAYNYNDTVDYIEVNDSLIGFRKKLKPNFKGSFETSDDKELLRVVFENDSLNLYYETPFSKWKETVLEASETHLKVINANKVVYLYKKYEPLDLN